PGSMIDSWTWQISFSLFFGLAGFLAVLLPVLLLQYSLYGRLSLARLVGAAALSVCAVALVAHTLLPLPDGSTCDGRSGAILLLVRPLAGRGISVATLTVRAVSLLVEITQYTGVFGLAGCAYRVADVDDLLAVAAGALLGALLAPLVAGWIPRPAALAALP